MNVTIVPPLVTTVKKAFVTPSSLGATAVVTAPSSVARIRVLGLVAITTLSNSIKFQSAATDISATFPLAANGGFSLPYTEHGWFETNAGETLNINLSVGTSTGLQLLYTVLPT